MIGLEEAMARAETEARRVIEMLGSELAAAGYDAHQVAPYPSRTRDSEAEYARKLERYKLLREITRPIRPGVHRYGPELRTIWETDCRRFILRIKTEAAVRYFESGEKQPHF